jgi:N-acetyl-anhydromuramyl-L-alanine amidase AmpD
VTAFDEDELCIDLKPDWMKTSAGVKKRTQGTDLIVIHHTGGEVIGPALNEALTAKGPHYEIDNEGHVVKFVADDSVAAHAGVSRWGGKEGCNANAIGIEIVHFQPAGKVAPPAIEEAQYQALIKLLKGLVDKLGIKSHRIVGHSDIRTTKADPLLLGSDRQTCPGGMFEWTRLEDAGLGMIPKQGVEIEDDWGGYFETYQEALRFGDSDTTKTYGGKRRKDVSGVIRELQLDLAGIGYSVKMSGEFDEHTRQAVDRFKRHFFTGSRSAQAPKSLAVSGDIDKDTANMIVAVRMGLPSDAPTQGMREPVGDEGDHAYALG